MSENPINDLRDAMDALTKPIRSAIWQDELDRDGQHIGQKLTKHVDQSLLYQLRHAISGDLGSHGGGSKAAHERTPFDVAAFTMYEDIDGRVKSWAADAGMKPSWLPVEDVLRAWFTVWTIKVIPDQLVDRHTAILIRWAVSINDLLSPPMKQELTAPCPLCGQMWATVGKGEETESVRALWAVWREIRDESYGMCRSCNHMWQGISAMRQLRISIDDQEAEQAIA